MKNLYYIVMLLLIFTTSWVWSQGTWRSSLYPVDWTPDFQDNEGRFLHDFSYSGYHNGEHPIPTQIPGVVVNVLDCGATPNGQADCTTAIQTAINQVSQNGGGIISIPAGLYRCDGKLTVSSPGVVIRGVGTQTQLQFTKVEGMSYSGHITFQGKLQQSADLLLAEDVPNRSKVVYVQNLGTLQPGDDISIGWVITDSFVAEHGMTGVWKVFNGKWQPFFLRKIVAIEPGNKIVLDVPVRYPIQLRDQPSIRRETGYLQECGIESLAIGNAFDWNQAWQEKSASAINFEQTKDCWAKDVSTYATMTYNSTPYHLQSKGIRVSASKRVTITGCSMQNAQNRGENGNGYLFEITRANEVLITNCFASAGRHNFIQNWGFGTTGCVFQKCVSEKGWAYRSQTDIFGAPGFCEYHHSLTMACLVEQCEIKDGWYGGNRRDWSSGAGHSVTQSVYWNIKGIGLSPLMSWQYGWGYIIGVDRMLVLNSISGDSSNGTSPADFLEGQGQASGLQPASLYQDQLQRRLARQEFLWPQQ